MGVTLGLAIYFILWWTVLFAVLPWGVRSHREAGVTLGEGADPGAPVLPQLLKKVFATTVVTTVLFAIGWAVWRAGWVSIDRLPMPYKDIQL
jgi:predicted secreted protein